MGIDQCETGQTDTGTDMAPGEDLNLPVETEEKLEEVTVAEVVEQEESGTGTDMAPVEDLNLPMEKVEELAVAEVAEQEEIEAGSDMAPVKDLNLPVEKVEEEAVAEVAEQEVIAELVNEESVVTPEVAEVLSSQSVIDEAADTETAVTTVESVIESVITESVDTSSAVEAVIDIEDTECRNRDSTFLTEIEDTKEINTDNVTEQESANNLNELEKSIEESEKDITIVESIGEIEEGKPPIEDESANIEESIKKKECVEDIIISDVTKLDEDSFKTEVIQDETEFIEPIETDIDNDALLKEIDVTESAVAEEKTESEIEADVIADKPCIQNITEDTINTEKIPIFTLAMVAYVVFMALFVIVYY